MNERRQQSVGRLLREVISEVLRDEVRDPRVKLASVASVEVTADLQHAKVRLSILGTDEEKCQECFRAIERATAFIRRSVGTRIRLRFTPELHFSRDRGAEHADKVQRILREISAEEKPTEPPIETGETADAPEPNEGASEG